MILKLKDGTTMEIENFSEEYRPTRGASSLRIQKEADKEDIVQVAKDLEDNLGEITIEDKEGYELFKSSKYIEVSRVTRQAGVDGEGLVTQIHLVVGE